MQIEPRNVFLARQPILDRNRRLIGYELLFRSSQAASAQVSEPARATARVAVDAFLSMGVATVLGPHLGFLNVDHEMLANEAIEALPTDRIVLEVLETTPAWARARCIELRRLGFKLALDDFAPGDEREALLDSVDYVKVDLSLTDRSALPGLVRELRKHPVQLLAEKVETVEDFRACSALGFELFQGYFFAKPTTLSGRRHDAGRAAALSAFRAISEDSPRAELENVFKRNARLGMQLLRIANSAALGPGQKIKTLGHAILYVGLQPLRRWLLLMLYAEGDAEPSTSPTLEIAAVRGRMLELLAPLVSRRTPHGAEFAERAFLAGVLSLGDTMLHAKLGDILDELRVESDVRSAILEHSGALGQLLRIAEALEAGEFAALSALLGAAGISAEELHRAQCEAYAWFRQMTAPEPLGAKS